MLALMQFIVVFDFMVVSSLGNMLMKLMNLKTSQFGFVVSSYTFNVFCLISTKAYNVINLFF